MKQMLVRNLRWKLRERSLDISETLWGKYDPEKLFAERRGNCVWSHFFLESDC